MRNEAQRDAKNALVNILVFPGLGSLRSGRRVAGWGQIILVLTGCALLVAWFFKEMSQYYGMMFGDEKPKAIGWIGATGGALFAISWLWAGVTSLSLFQAASKPNPTPPVIPPAAKMNLDADTLRTACASLPKWQRHGEIISRTYEFEDFVAAMKFVNAVAALAERAQHHPDIDVRWNKVTLALTTHDAGGLTEKDFVLARECDGQAGL